MKGDGGEDEENKKEGGSRIVEKVGLEWKWETEEEREERWEGTKS